jgi:hypothetical protein
LNKKQLTSDKSDYRPHCNIIVFLSNMEERHLQNIMENNVATVEGNNNIKLEKIYMEYFYKLHPAWSRDQTRNLRYF